MSVENGMTPEQAFKENMPLEEMKKYSWFHTPKEVVNKSHTLTYMAAGYGRIDVIQEQLLLGADLLQPMPGSGSIALHKAACTWNVDVARFIVNTEVGTECVNVINKHNESPLENSVIVPDSSSDRLNDELIIILLTGMTTKTFNVLVNKSRVSDVIFKKKYGQKGFSFLHFAAKAKNQQICELLVARGGQLLVNYASATGETALSIVLKNKCGDTRIHAMLMKEMTIEAVRSSIIEATENSDYEVNSLVSTEERGQRQLLYIASGIQRHDLVKMLVEEFNTEINCIDLDYGSTPLINLACKGPEYESLEYLCAKGADQNIVNKKGETAFAFVLHPLIKRGCNVNIDSFLQGVNPTQWVEDELNGETVSMEHLGLLLGKFIDSGNKLFTECLYKTLKDRDENVDLRPYVARAIESGHANSLKASLKFVTEDVLIEVLKSKEIYSANHKFGNTQLFAAITEADKQFLIPFMKHCYPLEEEQDETSPTTYEVVE